MAAEGFTNNSIENLRSASAGLMSGDRLRKFAKLGIGILVGVGFVTGIIGVAALMAGVPLVASALTYPVVGAFVVAGAAGLASGFLGK